MKYTYEDYLGDGLYAAFDGYQIKLAANDKAGGFSTGVVALEPNVVAAFERYVKRLRDEGIPI